MIKDYPAFEGFNITFNTNEDCNLACSYCYEINKKKKVLPLDYAKKFIDIILTEEDPINVKGTDDAWILDQGLTLDFIGGDSLMHPDLVEKILEYFIYKSRKLNHRWRNNWRASISTNGTLFGREDVRKFLEKWKDVISVGVSIDGNEALHDLNRKYPNGEGSLATIEKWMPWYTSVFGEPAFQTKSTLGKNSIPYIFDSLKYMHEELGLKWVHQNFIFEDMELSGPDLIEIENQFKKCVPYVLDHRDDLYWGMLDKEVPVSYEENCARLPNKGFCGSGAMPALSVDGKIYPCFRFLPHTQQEDGDFSVGSVFTGFDKKTNFSEVRAQTREKISPDQCKSCDIESMCSWCIAGAYSEKKEFYRQTYICEVTKIRGKYSKIYWEEFEKRNKI